MPSMPAYIPHACSACGDTYTHKVADGEMQNKIKAITKHSTKVVASRCRFFVAPVWPHGGAEFVYRS